jgi:hypothetical protein
MVGLLVRERRVKRRVQARREAVDVNMICRTGLWMVGGETRQGIKYLPSYS